jgi:hypothetical protein
MEIRYLNEREVSQVIGRALSTLRNERSQAGNPLLQGWAERAIQAVAGRHGFHGPPQDRHNKQLRVRPQSNRQAGFGPAGKNNAEKLQKEADQYLSWLKGTALYEAANNLIKNNIPCEP